jgi:hypothetical protein
MAVLALLCTAGSALAAEQVTFGRKQAAGDKYSFNQTMTMDNTVSVSANGQVVQQVKQGMTQNLVGTLAIEAVNADGRPTKAVYTFDKSSGGEQSMNGQKQPVPSGLAGKTLTLTRDGDKVTVDPQVDPAAEKEVTNLFKDDTNFFPKKPISVGDTWEIDPNEFKSMLPPGGQANGKASGKLLSVETVNGRQVADVEVNLSISAAVQGITMKFDMQGKGKVDVASGQPVEMEMKGPIKGSGRQQTPQGAVDIAMDGNMSMTMKNKPEAHGGA